MKKFLPQMAHSPERRERVQRGSRSLQQPGVDDLGQRRNKPIAMGPAFFRPSRILLGEKREEKNRAKSSNLRMRGAACQEEFLLKKLPFPARKKKGGDRSGSGKRS